MVHGWYAPSLHDSSEAGLQRRSVAAAAAFLRTGKSPKAVMMGPMAGVVYESLQYLSPADANAMAVYLTSLPERETPEMASRGAMPRLKDKLALGERIYDERCRDCHGGEGRGDDGISALAGNPGVTLSNPRNVINMIRRGGFPASVPGHPRPHGMPPHYGLSEREVAAVAIDIRCSWGNAGSVVSTIDVGRR
jgi:mono/diheme cytochrome c family protein